MALVSSNTCTFSFPPFFPSTTSAISLTFQITKLTPRLHSATCSFQKPISSTTFIKPLNASMPQKYIYPDPIPKFAESETLKFKRELLQKLSRSKEFGNDVNEVVKVCAEILNNFLREEYGGPGTLLVEPFTDMLVALKEKNLPGAPEAARASLLWAQNYLDKDWETWISKQHKTTH